MAYPRILQRIFANNGGGSKIRSDAIPDDVITQTKGDARYLGKTATAQAAINATNDGGGISIANSYQKKYGDRGNVSAYATAEVVSGNYTLDEESNENVCVTGAGTITINDGSSGKAWEKTVDIRNASVAIAFGSANWGWLGGKVPTPTENCVLSVHWCNGKGIASLLSVS